jgi:hypothetical protein
LVQMERLELSRPKSPPPQECSLKFKIKHKYNNLHLKSFYIRSEIVAAPVI